MQFAQTPTLPHAEALREGAVERGCQARKQPLVRPFEQEIGDQADHADDDDPEDDLAGVEQRLAVGDHVADAGGRADQFRDDHISPRPAEDEPQRFRDRRRGARQQHAPHDARRVRAERVGRLDEVAARGTHLHGHHQHDLEERPDEDHQQLLHLADPCPQDQERNERGGRQIARERDERLEEGLDRLVRAHRDAERHRGGRRQHEAPDDAPDRDADVASESVLGEQRPAFADHRKRIGEERLRHEPAECSHAPRSDEEGEERQSERDLAAARDRLERRHGRRRCALPAVWIGGGRDAGDWGNGTRGAAPAEPHHG